MHGARWRHCRYSFPRSPPLRNPAQLHRGDRYRMACDTSIWVARSSTSSRAVIPSTVSVNNAQRHGVAASAAKLRDRGVPKASIHRLGPIGFTKQLNQNMVN